MMKAWREYRGSAGSGSGFTLPELLVVLAVLSIILAIAISAILDARDKAKQAATMADMHSIGVAITAYTVDFNHPPTSDLDFAEVASLLDSNHLNNALPLNDHWRNEYNYNSSGQGYSLISYGKGGIDGADLTWESRLDFERDIILVNGLFRYLEDLAPVGKKSNNGKHFGKDHGTGKPQRLR